jgi:MYXO-CTERM domain-containing protein
LSTRLLLWLLAATGLAAGACVEGPAPEELNALDVCVLANDGDLCDDHQPCTDPDLCVAMKCVGTPVANRTRCTDGNVCTSGDVCMAAVCVGTVLPDGTSCTDGDPCTDPDVCQLGVCQPGGPAICDDGDACTLDSCMSGIGCVFSPRECTMPVDARVDTPPDIGADLGADATSDARSDASSPDVGDALPEAGIADGGGRDVGDAAMAVDAIDAGGGGDAADANADLVETPPDLRARGGGCQCTLGGDDRVVVVAPAPLAFALALLATLTLRRRRRKDRNAKTPGRQDGYRQGGTEEQGA